MTLRLPWPKAAASFAAILGALTLAPSRATTEPLPRISGPIVHENVAIYLVHGTSVPGPVPQTLQEALGKGTVIVHETGNVQNLEIENKGNEAVFVQFGDIVKGGQQDRVLTVSLLLESNSGKVPIGAYCVEQGRWAARGAEDVKRFAVSESLMPSREAKIAMAKPAADLRAGLTTTSPSATGRQPEQVEPSQQAGERTQRNTNVQTAGNVIVQERRTRPGVDSRDGQSEVWRSVSNVQQQLSANLASPVASEKSRTSLQLALEHEKLKTAQTAYLSAIEPAALKDDDVVGVVVAVNGKLSSADVYPSNGLFRKMWPKIARAAATEALSGRATVGTNGKADATASSPSTPPKVEAVSAFLTDAGKGKSSERALGSHAKVETRDADKSLRVETRSAKGEFVHRNYLSK